MINSKNVCFAYSNGEEQVDFFKNKFRIESSGNEKLATLII